MAVIEPTSEHALAFQTAQNTRKLLETQLADVAKTGDIAKILEMSSKVEASRVEVLGIQKTINLEKMGEVQRSMVKAIAEVLNTHKVESLLMENVHTVVFSRVAATMTRTAR